MNSKHEMQGATPSATPSAPPSPAATKPQAPESTAPQATSNIPPAPVTRSRRVFGAANLELTSEEFNSPITSKFLFNDVERLEDTLRELEPYRQRYSEMDKRAAVLQTELNSVTAVDNEKQKNQMLADVGLALGVGLGGVLLGLVPSINEDGMKLTVGLVACALVIFGVVVKVTKK